MTMERALRNCCVIILAAGRSDRMGRPKQLLRYRGKTLLEHVVGEAKASDANAVMVILGCSADEIMAETGMTGTQLVLNRDWERGMASSLVAGISAIMDNEHETDAVILLVCDQPFVDSALLNALIARQNETGKPIIACEYGDSVGVPALFCKSYFDQLLALKGDSGAKKLIFENMEAVAVIPFPLGNIDIDTPEAYQKLDQNVI